MNLVKALRIDSRSRMALVGAGGKTTALFRLGDELPPPVLLTATTHLGESQVAQAGRHVIATRVDQIQALQDNLTDTPILVTGPFGPDGRTLGLDAPVLDALKSLADDKNLPLLIEADGSRQRPLKAPAEHEPAIPGWVSQVVVVAGLSGLGKPLGPEWIHRPEIFAALTGMKMGKPVSPEALGTLLAHPQGGLKHIPARARKIALLNQVDHPEAKNQAEALTPALLENYSAVVIARLENEPESEVLSVRERIAGIVLAAGESRRLGQPKQLLLWRGEPLVRHVVRIALEAGLKPVVVVTGAEAGVVSDALQALPVSLVDNAEWASGQSSSVRRGIGELSVEVGAAIFLLSDQPQVPVKLIEQLEVAHSHSLSAIIAPKVGERRANPVLFDRSVFSALAQVKGDMGGRAIFDQYPVEWVDWKDPSLLLDVDTPEDYARLREIE
ncbi:MAG: selenium cofactor biosynthesis protein YqeC [Chloroflexi bacterium]|nr:selenium cofactor biosynthesis protein YqeC [Chloroflexota bacterium]